MIYLIVLLPGLILAALVGALVYAYRKLARAHFLLLVAALVLVPASAWKYEEHEFLLQAVPEALGVRTRVWWNEESWGFGPGGNEAGVRFYELPEDVSRAVAARGLTFFEKLPGNPDQPRRVYNG